MTDLLYYKDAYLKSVDATVVDVNADGIILDKTIFYPECGGQPGDRGTFGAFVIKDTQKSDEGEPLHLIDGAKPNIGDTLTLTLDWAHRYKYMIEHSAQHLISATLFKEFSIGTVAVHQGERILTIETDKDEIDDGALLQVEDSANSHVREGLRIYQEEVDHKEAEELNMRRSIKVDGRVKLVYIEGLDVVACGGVHVSNSKEIGEIHYCGKELIRGHVRTIWCVNEEAVEDRRENERVLKEAYKLLSATRESLSLAINRLHDENIELKRRMKSLEEVAARSELNDALASGNNPIIFKTELALDAFVHVLAGDIEAFIVNECNKTFLYYGSKERFALLKDKLNLRGGGKSALFRGSYSIDAILDEAGDILRS